MTFTIHDRTEELEHLGYYLKAIKDVFQRTGKINPMAIWNTVLADYPDIEPRTLRENLADYLTMPYIDPDAGTAISQLKNSHQVRKILSVCQNITQKAMQNSIKFEDLYAMMNQESSDVSKAATYEPQQNVLQDWIGQQKNNTSTLTGSMRLIWRWKGGLQDGNVMGWKDMLKLVKRYWQAR